MDQKNPKIKGGIKEPSEKWTPWKLEFFKCKGWSGKTSPKDAKSGLTKRCKRKFSPLDFDEESILAVHNDLAETLNGAVRHGGDKEYKQKMKVIAHHLEQANDCLNLNLELSKDAQQGLAGARELLMKAKQQHEKENKNKQIKELDLCLQSLDKFENDYGRREDKVKEKQEFLRELGQSELDAPGGLIEQVNTLVLDLGKRKPQSGLNKPVNLEKSPQELKEGCSLILENLALSNPFTTGVLLDNLPGCKDKSENEKAETQSEHLALLLGYGDQKSQKEFFRSTKMPIERLGNVLVKMDKVPPPSGHTGLVDKDVPKTETVTAWAENALSDDPTVAWQTCDELLKKHYISKEVVKNDNTQPMRASQLDALLLKGMVLAKGGKEEIEKSLGKILEGCKQSLSIDVKDRRKEYLKAKGFGDKTEIPDKIGTEADNYAKEKVAEDIQPLIDLAKGLLKTIACMALPESLCLAAAKIYQQYLDHGFEETRTLVGGFVLLRVIVPMLTNNTGPAGVSLGKIVQKLSNGTRFTEPHLKPLNEALDQLESKMNDFLHRVIGGSITEELRKAQEPEDDDE